MKRPATGIFLFVCFLVVTLPLSAQRIERVEPPNWWVGMKWSNLQVLVYGESIATLNPKIVSEHVRLDQVIKTQNPNYVFLYLNIKPEATAGEVAINFYDSKNRLKTSYPFALRARKQGSADIEGFNNSDVIYLITPDRFANGNPDNDEKANMPDKLNRADKGGRHGGDIKGITDNLDYIKNMGFTAIWLNPIVENDMPAYSYHGYAATDFYRVDPRYGSNEDYRDMIQTSADQGIKVIMDMIINHSGSEHWFVLDPPMSDWINNQDNFVQTSHKRNTIQDIHASEYDKKAFSDGWFVRTMPDLNQRNELMADYLTQNTIWWIEYSGISGIRMDTYPYPDKDYMSEWTCAVMNEYPNFSIVGEEWTVNPAIVSYWQAGKVNHDGYTSCLPNVMDFPLQNALRESLNDKRESWNTGFIKMYEALANDFLYADPDNLVIFPDNHDMDRFFTQVKKDVDLFKMGLTYIATMRGIPQIYYGTEIAMHNEGSPGDHGVIRSDFPGGWEGDVINGFTGEGLTDEQKDIQSFVRKLLNWRKTSTVIHRGNLIQFAPENGVYSYIRSFNDQKVLVILNKNQGPYSLNFDKYDELLVDDATGYDVLNDQKINLKEPLALTPQSAYIIEIKQ
jgi:glycosidase